MTFAKAAAPGRAAVFVRDRSGGKYTMRRVVIVHGNADLPEFVGALGPASRLSGRLHRRQQQRDQDADDRDHHQQLNQCKTV